jgi:hypothetical protein
MENLELTYAKNMVNKINKERRRSLNAIPTRQEPASRCPGGPQTKTGQVARQSTGRLLTRMILKKK